MSRGRPLALTVPVEYTQIETMATVTSPSKDFSALREKVKNYLSPEKLDVLEQAYQFALEAHRGQTRLSGGPFLEHPLETALILSDLQLDVTSLAAALLHDVPEDCGVPISEIEKRFGPEVSKLVDGVTKLSRITQQAAGHKPPKSGDDSQTQAENLRKMLVAMAEDLRVVFIKLADRLHNMRTLQALPPERQQSIARETLDIYAPLAHRLGIWEIKSQLEDLAFSYLEAAQYRHISLLVSERGAAGREYIDKAIAIIRRELAKAGIKAEVSGRPKNLYSIYQKAQKYAAQGKSFGDIYDIMALRILVDEVQDCYSALGVVHNLWHPLTSEFNDYIANPKESGYQSLHTTVMCFGTTPLEIQIRTHQMHHLAEYGLAAHWRYKEGAKMDLRFEEKIAWLRQLMEWHRSLSGATEFLESVKTDIFRDQVFIYTPKGEIKDLPAGATPLDFAYRIHTDLGHRCVGAKVNGRLVSLTYQLRNGDTVEIITSKTSHGPSRDWLNPNLGYIKTSQAREKIRQWFKKRQRAENVERGRELLQKELRRLGLSSEIQEELPRLFKYDSLEEFLAAIGYGGISPSQIAVKLATQQEPPSAIEISTRPQTVTPSIRVLGVGDLLTQMGRCCNPVPGDHIVGYVTRTKGVTIHRSNCPNILHQDEKERLVSVEWGDNDQLYPVTVRIEAWDRMGLLRDISTLVAEERVNIASVNTNSHNDQTASIFLTLEVKSIDQLSVLLSKLEGVRGVTNAVRSTDKAVKNA